VIKRAISFIVFLLVLNCGARVGMVYFHDQQFKDAVRDLALFAGQPRGQTDEMLKARVMQLAEENHIPLDGDFIEVSRRANAGIGDKVTVKFKYAVMVPVLPGYERRFDFDYVTP